MSKLIRIESSKKNAILIVEALVCFGPVTALLLVGIGTWVNSIYYMVADQSYDGLLFITFLLVFIIGGLLGVASLISILIVITDKGNGFLSPFKTRLYMTIGTFSILAISSVALSSGVGLTVLIVVFPLLSAAHIYWTGKEKLSIIENSSACPER